MDPNTFTAARIASALRLAIEQGRVKVHDDGYIDTVAGTLTVTVTICPGEVRRYE